MAIPTMLRPAVWLPIVAIGAALWGYVVVGTALVNRLPQVGVNSARWNASMATQQESLFSFSVAIAMVAAFAGAQVIVKRQSRTPGPILAGTIAVFLTALPIIRMAARAAEIGLEKNALAYGAVQLAGYAAAGVLLSYALWPRNTLASQ